MRKELLKRVRRYVFTEANKNIKIYKKWITRHPNMSQNIDTSISTELKRCWRLANKLTNDFKDDNYLFYTDKKLLLTKTNKAT